MTQIFLACGGHKLISLQEFFATPIGSATPSTREHDCQVCRRLLHVLCAVLLGRVTVSYAPPDFGRP